MRDTLYLLIIVALVVVCLFLYNKPSPEPVEIIREIQVGQERLDSALRVAEYWKAKRLQDSAQATQRHKREMAELRALNKPKPSLQDIQAPQLTAIFDSIYPLKNDTLFSINISQARATLEDRVHYETLQRVNAKQDTVITGLLSDLDSTRYNHRQEVGSLRGALNSYEQVTAGQVKLIEYWRKEATKGKGWKILGQWGPPVAFGLGVWAGSR